ncbi:MAG TPA: RICIN domain-containing protein [Polyangia bacterium]
METTFRLEGSRSFPVIHAHVPLLCLMVAFASACSFDESKLRASSSRALDGAIDHSADVGAAPVGTEGAREAGQVDSGATDQAPPTAGSDAALVPDSQDSSSANPGTALDGAIDHSADADAVPAGTWEVGQVDFGATDQAPPTSGSDAPVGQDGQDGQDGSGASPDTASNGDIDGSGQDGGGANPDSNTDTNSGTGIVADGTYRIIARHSGKALDVYWEATADGSNVDQWTYDGGKNQLWTLTHLGGNVYKILGVQSGKVLEVATTSTADDTNVDIRTYTGAANQQWTISALSGSYFRLTPMSISGSALDVGGVSMTDGANVHIWTWLGGSYYNQQWTFQAP